MGRNCPWSARNPKAETENAFIETATSPQSRELGCDAGSKSDSGKRPRHRLWRNITFPIAPECRQLWHSAMSGDSNLGLGCYAELARRALE